MFRLPQTPSATSAAPAIQAEPPVTTHEASMDEGSICDHSTIHRDGGTRHVRRIRRSNKGDHVSDLLRCRQAFDRYRRHQRRFVCLRVGETCEHARIRSTRIDYVYPDSTPRAFQCTGLCQPFHRRFAGHTNDRPPPPDPSTAHPTIHTPPHTTTPH